MLACVHPVANSRSGTMSFSVTSAGIILPSLSDDVQSVDVFFGDDRVWSIDLNTALAGPRGRYRWPKPILPYLHGSTHVTLKHSADGSVLATSHVAFSNENLTTRVLDEDGIPLAMNKWGRLGKTLEAGNEGVQERILDRTEELIAHLEALGLRPFIVGGTLLGAVRDQALLPHDDDADIAYLSEYTNPADIAREGFEIGHKLQDLGYEVVRHSATHMQLYFRNSSGHLDHYVDVFSAFFTEDGHINQPFHVRGEMRMDQMLPFSRVSIQGRDFPAPADPEHWLVINYDENWRTPIPGYRLHTPRPTIRRFQNWFGSFHFKRDFWNDLYQDHGESADHRWRSGADWILSQSDELTAPWLLDVGCGAGELSAKLKFAHPDRKVIACDYSTYALAVAGRHGAEAGVTTAHVNLYRTIALGLPASQGIEAPFDFVANHLLDVLGKKARPNTFRLIRMALRSGGSAVATLYGSSDMAGNAADPTTWGFSPDALVATAEQYGVQATITPLPAANHERSRDPYGVVFSLTAGHEEES